MKSAFQATAIFVHQLSDMKKLFLVFAILPLHLLAQYPNVMIGNSKVLRRSLCEPSISVNKADPANVVAGAILDRVFYSNDSGKTWTGDTLKSTYGVWGDPVVVSDFKGTQYFLHLSDPTGLNWSSEEILDRIVCQKSTDGGKTWNNGSYMGFNHPKDQDKHWMAVDPKNNTLYTTWTQFDVYGSEEEKDKSNILFSRSVDGGESWSKDLQINELSGNCLDGDQTTEGAVPAVSPYGDVYVAWSYNDKIYFDRSADGGETWLEKDIVVADQPGGWEIDIPGLQRANGMPVTVCDVSDGPFRGSIYVNWVDDRDGHHDVWVSRSLDGGDTWSEALKVNDDDTKADQFFTWMSCDPVTGYLYCVFYDRRNHKEKDLMTDVYMAYSKDGGVTWVNEMISESPFKPNAIVFFGDYNHIDAYDGVVRPIWTRLDRDNGMSIWTALINMK